jgi:RNA polymerase sigma-70 factor (ECF subfamily)
MTDLKNEANLIKQAQAGSSEAVALLWEAVTPKLFGYLVNVLKNKTVAEDILQNTWLKAIKALPNFKQQGYGVSTWLFAIARNECNQYWRKEKDHLSLEDSFIEPSKEATQVIDNAINIERALAQLSNEEQELLRLRYIADLPINDIARILNISFVSVRVKLHRALKKVKI